MAIHGVSTHDGFLSRAFAALSRLARAIARRRLVGDLGRLDDRMLADMGITRADVVSALAEPLFVDPSEQLAQRARAARLARRAMARERLDGAELGGEDRRAA